MTCDDARSLVDLYASGDLRGFQLSRLQTHLFRCRHCYGGMRRARETQGVLQDYLNHLRPRASLATHVLARLQETPPPARISVVREPTRARVAWWHLAAALLVLAAGIAFLLRLRAGEQRVLARIARVEGAVEVLRASGNDSRPVTADLSVRSGDRIEAAAGSRIVVLVGDSAEAALDGEGWLRFEEEPPGVRIVAGAGRLHVRNVSATMLLDTPCGTLRPEESPAAFVIELPSAENARDVDPAARISLEAGSVRFENGDRAWTLESPLVAMLRPSGPPEPVVEEPPEPEPSETASEGTERDRRRATPPARDAGPVLPGIARPPSDLASLLDRLERLVRSLDEQAGAADTVFRQGCEAFAVREAILDPPGPSIGSQGAGAGPRVPGIREPEASSSTELAILFAAHKRAKGAWRDALGALIADRAERRPDEREAMRTFLYRYRDPITEIPSLAMAYAILPWPWADEAMVRWRDWPDEAARRFLAILAWRILQSAPAGKEEEAFRSHWIRWFYKAVHRDGRELLARAPWLLAWLHAPAHVARSAAGDEWEHLLQLPDEDLRSVARRVVETSGPSEIRANALGFLSGVVLKGGAGSLPAETLSLLGEWVDREADERRLGGPPPADVLKAAWLMGEGGDRQEPRRSWHPLARLAWLDGSLADGEPSLWERVVEEVLADLGREDLRREADLLVDALMLARGRDWRGHSARELEQAIREAWQNLQALLVSRKGGVGALDGDALRESILRALATPRIFWRHRYWVTLFL